MSRVVLVALVLLLTGCAGSVPDDDASPLEKEIERTHQHTFDLRIPPSRAAVGLLPGDNTVDYNCSNCKPYRFTFLLPSGETFIETTQKMYIATDIVGGGDEPAEATMERPVPIAEIERTLRELQGPMNLDERSIRENVRRVSGFNLDQYDATFINDLPCDGYLAPTIGFYSNSREQGVVRMVYGFNWGDGYCQ